MLIRPESQHHSADCTGHQKVEAPVGLELMLGITDLLY